MIAFLNFVLHTETLQGFILSLQMTIPNKSLIIQDIEHNLRGAYAKFPSE